MISNELIKKITAEKTRCEKLVSQLEKLKSDYKVDPNEIDNVIGFLNGNIKSYEAILK